MVSDSCIELPFFPQYETEHLCDGKLRVTWFESKFSQSHYNVHNITRGSNACTLIAVLMAAKCHNHNIQINQPEMYLNSKLIHKFALSMLEGNRIHEELKQQHLLPHINLNVPEAIKFAEKQTKGIVEWKSEIFMEPISKTLYGYIKKNWREWLKTQGESDEYSDLYVILVADSRTVLFIIQLDAETVTLLDSHQHNTDKGAFIATAKRSKLKCLCQWYIDVMTNFYKSEPELYELSFLYFDSL